MNGTVVDANLRNVYRKMSYNSIDIRIRTE